MKVKEEELTTLRNTLETGSNSHADTVSSDGGETIVPEVDLSKIEAQVKEDENNE